LKKYEGKIQFVYKHLPLSFHRNAKIASQYYEAIRLESPEKAFKFHDYIFENQKKLAMGEKFLKKAAKSVGADMKNIEKNKNSESVLKRIDQDMKEAAKFGMQGTPGFILNGIPVKGAYPPEHFDKIVDKLKEKGMVKL
jgi:protein-disulfide isomerase